MQPTRLCFAFWHYIQTQKSPDTGGAFPGRCRDEDAATSAHSDQKPSIVLTYTSHKPSPSSRAGILALTMTDGFMLIVPITKGIVDAILIGVNETIGDNGCLNQWLNRALLSSVAKNLKTLLVMLKYMYYNSNDTAKRLMKCATISGLAVGWESWCLYLRDATCLSIDFNSCNLSSSPLKQRACTGGVLLKLK